MTRTIIVRRDYLHFVRKYGRFEKRHNVRPALSSSRAPQAIKTFKIEFDIQCWTNSILTSGGAIELVCFESFQPLVAPLSTWPESINSWSVIIHSRTSPSTCRPLSWMLTKVSHLYESSNFIIMTSFRWHRNNWRMSTIEQNCSIQRDQTYQAPRAKETILEILNFLKITWPNSECSLNLKKK